MGSSSSSAALEPNKSTISWIRSFFRAHKWKIIQQLNLSPRFRATIEPTKILSHNEPILSQPQFTQYWLIVAQGWLIVAHTFFLFQLHHSSLSIHKTLICWLCTVGSILPRCCLTVGSLLAWVNNEPRLSQQWAIIEPTWANSEPTVSQQLPTMSQYWLNIIDSILVYYWVNSWAKLESPMSQY